MTKEELERMGPTQLAVLCGKVAESPTAGSVEADQGRDLKYDWAKLIARAVERRRIEQVAGREVPGRACDRPGDTGRRAVPRWRGVS